MAADHPQGSTAREAIENEAVIRSEHWNGVESKYFQPAKWESLLCDDFGRKRYGTFIEAMIRRITLNASNNDEIEQLVVLVTPEHNGEFLRVALPYLPNFVEAYP